MPLLLLLLLFPISGGSGFAGGGDESSSNRERPVSFCTSAMKSRGCVWMILGECV